MFWGGFHKEVIFLKQFGWYHVAYTNPLTLSGPSVLDVFNTLVKHLRISLDKKSEDPTIRAQEKKFEESIINTIGKIGLYHYL